MGKEISVFTWIIAFLLITGAVLPFIGMFFVTEIPTTQQIKCYVYEESFAKTTVDFITTPFLWFIQLFETLVNLTIPTIIIDDEYIEPNNIFTIFLSYFEDVCDVIEPLQTDFDDGFLNSFIIILIPFINLPFIGDFFEAIFDIIVMPVFALLYVIPPIIVYPFLIFILVLLIYILASLIIPG